MKGIEPIKKPSIKSGVKVVCLDTPILDENLTNLPKGWPVLGRVYCVSGITDGGRILLVGLDVNFHRTGNQIGFDPAGFCTLEQFRLKFPKDILSILKGGVLRGARSCSADTQSNPVQFPHIEGVEALKTFVQIAVETVETIYYEQNPRQPTDSWRNSWPQDQSSEEVKSELRELLRSSNLPALRIESFVFRQLLGRSKIILFCRSRSPLANVVFQLCRGKADFTDRMLDGFLTEADFQVMLASVIRLVGDPIQICDAREPDTFLNMLFDAHADFDYAICDWKLSGRELAVAYRMTRNSQIAFLCPEL